MFNEKFIGKKDIHGEKLCNGELISFKTTSNSKPLEGIIFYDEDSTSFRVDAVDISVEFGFNQIYDIEII